MQDSMKFDREKSTPSIPFLDNLVYVDKNRQVETTLHTKPKITYNNLHFKSSQPKHLKDSLTHKQLDSE